jgi:HSP20 family molecular chaperone IbpA
MWSEALRMLDDADRLSQQFFRLQEQQHTAGVWEPPVDIYETEQEWNVLIALPGVPPERIHYRLDGDCLDIAGERAMPRECTEGVIRRKEVPHGRFVRRLRFRAPPLEVSRATLKDGCLLLTLRKPNI